MNKMHTRTAIKIVGTLASLAVVATISTTPAWATKMDKQHNNKTVITTFTSTNGGLPSASPNCYPASATWNKKAACFGAGYVGGNPGYGTLYSTNGNGTGLRTLLNFTVFNGLMPSQAPVLGPDGATLYGTTTQGGDSGVGLVYAYNMQSKTMTTLASFNGTNGGTEQGAPIIVGNNLYGFAGQGGAFSSGVIWTLPLSGGSIQVLHSFAGGQSDFAIPFGSPTYNPTDGQVYGIGFTGGPTRLGGIFSIAPDGSNYQVRAGLSLSTGAAPQMGALSIGPDGQMYGNGWLGGVNQLGTIFAFNPATNNVSTVFNYTNATGTQPYSGVQFSTSGNWMYVLGWQGGKYGQGTIVAVSIDGTRSRVLANLRYESTGGRSFAKPSLSVDGNRIIAAVTLGGAKNFGTLISMPIPANLR